MKEGDNFGLIGKGIDYSFSKDYFTKKFNKEKINCEYHNFDIEDSEQEYQKPSSLLHDLNGNYHKPSFHRHTLRPRPRVWVQNLPSD